MDAFADAAILGLKLAYLFGFSGAAFALGVATVCRWLKWAPIDITINVGKIEKARSR